MGRLIDADALLEKFNKKSDIWTALTDEKTANDFALYCKVEDAIEDTPTVGGWISVKDRMPESQTCVLVTVKTIYGKLVVLIACHINSREVDSEDYRWQDAEINWDYDEENDIYWVPECWYEVNFVEENTSWIIDEYADGIVTHWMPLPSTEGLNEA